MTTSSLPSGVASRLGFLASPALASTRAERCAADLDAADLALKAGLVRAAHEALDEAWLHMSSNKTLRRRYERLVAECIAAERAGR